MVTTYTPLMTVTFRFLTCAKISNLGFFIKTQPDIRCYDGEYYSWFGLFVPLLAYIAFVPIFLVVLLYQFRRNGGTNASSSAVVGSPRKGLDQVDEQGVEMTAIGSSADQSAQSHRSSVTKSATPSPPPVSGPVPFSSYPLEFRDQWKNCAGHLLTVHFRESYYGWEVYSLGRRLILLMLGAIASPVTDLWGQRLVYFGLLVVYLLIHLFCHPYMADVENWAETISLATLVVLGGLLSSESFSREGFSRLDKLHGTVIALGSIAGLSLLLLVLYPKVQRALVAAGIQEKCSRCCGSKPKSISNDIDSNQL
jgi:hypothetical protein